MSSASVFGLDGSFGSNLKVRVFGMGLWGVILKLLSTLSYILYNVVSYTFEALLGSNFVCITPDTRVGDDMSTEMAVFMVAVVWVGMAVSKHSAMVIVGAASQNNVVATSQAIFEAIEAYLLMMVNLKQVKFLLSPPCFD